MSCDYTAANEFHLDPGAAGRGWVSGGARARIVDGVVTGHTTRRYCSRAHLALATIGTLAGERAVAEELVHHPLLADGN